MTLNGMSAFSAAARLLAFGAFVPTGSSVAVTVMSKLRISPAIIMALGATLQISGAAPLSRAPTGSHVEPWQYVCQVLIGLGVGFIISAVMILIPKAVEEKDLGVYGCLCFIFLVANLKQPSQWPPSLNLEYSGG